MNKPATGSGLTARATVALVAAGALLLGLAASGGDAAAAALRAVAIVAILAVGAVALRWRRTRGAAPDLVSVLERHALARESGVAVITAGGRRLLVGFAPGGVALLRDLDERAEGTS